MKILMIMTSHAKLGDTGKDTGLWLEEFAAPYYVFKDAGAKLTLATPKGGRPPVDPNSLGPDALTPATERLAQDAAANAEFSNTLALNSVSANDFDGIFYPGGHGPLWDLANNPDSARLISQMLSQHKPVAAVCHGPGVFRQVNNAQGQSWVLGKRVTGFSNSEEAAAGLTEVVPFLVEDMLKEQGGHYYKSDDWQPHVETDGLLITGQNPASSAATAQALLDKLGAKS
ncbi:type 1 glutamine amidotransferase domain-containing protein [Oceanisphaera avium]|uniref:Type 1 glutamine amidotransferase domain-containing protein n=1 Tax=Oceanisphaera avium TaxID=1903694 RepID=A0A1Y0D049_9GAMM|nr:type 1 glutamine amidotransferase domain-containing protein [Oceanisphaera avium]ART80486.1 type 1 glutamine amidotransferase domain-containing protein [Oceanisphaera avium]